MGASADASEPVKVPLVSVPAPMPLESNADKDPNVEAPVVQPPLVVPTTLLEVKAVDGPGPVQTEEVEIRPRAPAQDIQKRKSRISFR
jgi:hypothetical protein